MSRSREKIMIRNKLAVKKGIEELLDDIASSISPYQIHAVKEPVKKLGEYLQDYFDKEFRKIQLVYVILMGLCFVMMFFLYSYDRQVFDLKNQNVSLKIEVDVLKYKLEELRGGK